MNRAEKILDAIALDAITKRGAASTTSLSKPTPSILHTILNRPLNWFMAFMLSAVMVGCGGNDPILGGGGAGVATPIITPVTPPVGAVVPGACTAPGPAVVSSNPVSGNQIVATSTTGVTNGGKSITATFNVAMDPTTITATTFKLSPVGGLALVPASVSYNALAATFTTTAPLLASTSYQAIITVGAKSAAGTPLSCSYAWNFKTATPAAAAAPPVNLGLAAPFGMATTAGLTNTITAPITHIEGNVVLSGSSITCNAVAVPGGNGTLGFGNCAGSPPTLNGTVITPTSPDTTTATAVVNDLKAAFLSITPPAGPPAAGSLGGATNIPAGSTLGGPAGSALVQGTNLFVPGVYQSLTSIMISGDLTLDAQGDPNASFIFQSSTTVGTAAGSAPPGPHTRILLVNGAKASNVWWQAASSATLGLYSEFQGNILASATITMKTGATSCGRMLAGAFTTGAFVFDANVVSVPGQPFAPPAGYSTICQ
jgi:hypothetical protein